MNVKSDCSSNLYCLLLQTQHRTKPALMKLADEHDLTGVQLHTLLSLSPGEAIPMHAVSLMLACDASNVTGIVDRLLGHDLITRQENPEDRRVKMISLSDKGEAVRQKLIQTLANYELPGVSRLSDDEIVQLKVILGKINAESM